MWQYAYLVKEKTLSDSGVEYIDLPRNEQIAMILIDFRATVASTVDHDRSILDVITDIDVLLEGSKVAYSANPEVASYFSFLTTGKIPPHLIHHAADYTNMVLPIWFGRVPFDTQYMLDTSKYANAQLQIAYALNTTYEDTGTAQLTVILCRPVTPVSPVGFIRSRLINEYAHGAAAEIKSLDLPSGLDWFDIGVRVVDDDEYFIARLTDLDLELNQGRISIFNGRIEDLKYLNQIWFDPWMLGPPVRGLHSDEDEMCTFLGYHRMINSILFTATGEHLQVNSWRGDHFDASLQTTAGATDTTDRAMLFQGVGCLPFDCILMGKFWEQPLSVPGNMDARVDYTLGAGAATVETFLREVVRGTL
jgi:hypothetical protein